MEKLVYLVWERPSVDPAMLRERLVGEIGAQLLALGPRALQIDVDDEHAQVPSMVPVPDDELPVRACVSVWLDAHDRRGPYEAVLGGVGVRRAGYLVTESMYTDYGGNGHAPARSWPDGERSPGITTLTVFDKPPGVDDETFYGHWYGHQSPMSEWMQPRCRYVRNAVVRPLTPGAPRYRAIVEESWPTAGHLTDLGRFFGSPDGADLAERVRIMLDSTKLLYDPATMRSYTMSEYILRS
ncbi:MAG: hypothetical protein KatS3mg009_0917 [Acidimicrobiia bacterium]|nr:MAG: hypothetical protein KatS3mg009_0917 [Acidimicrobiia bacterium]